MEFVCYYANAENEMKTINIKGQIYRDEYLAKPKYFFQIENLDKKTSHQFYNRKVTVEYVYDIDFELNRNISKDEICKIENALKSVVFCYADRARDALFIYDRMIHAYTGSGRKNRCPRSSRH